MSLRGTWYTIKQNVPKPAWVRFPNQQRFCCCCSIRTGASLVGWFDFIINSLYIGMLLLAMTDIRNVASDFKKHAEEYQLPNIKADGSRVQKRSVETTAPDIESLLTTTTASAKDLDLIPTESNDTDNDMTLPDNTDVETIKTMTTTTLTTANTSTIVTTTQNDPKETHTIMLPPNDDGLAVTPAVSPEDLKKIQAVIDFTLPIMYKSICIPALLIIFSILWLITVESRKILYVRLFGKAFIIAIFVQLIAQLGFLIYVEIKVKEFYKAHTSVVVWIVFAVYALLNMYFIPIVSEFIRRRRRECAQGMEQGLLTAEMNPRARVAEEYIQDAFTVEPDTDMVQFEASLVKSSYGTENSHASQNRRNSTEQFVDDGPI